MGDPDTKAWRKTILDAVAGGLVAHHAEYGWTYLVGCPDLPIRSVKALARSGMIRVVPGVESRLRTVELTEHGTAFRQALSLDAFTLPVRGELYDAIAAGAVDEVERRYGRRFDERACRPGRAVILRRGRQRGETMLLTVASFRKENRNDSGFLAVIRFAKDSA